MDKAERGANQTINRLKRFNVAGEVIMDIGGNIGHVSRWLKDNGAAKVVAYEPHPEAFKQLKKRCPDIEAINAGLLTKSGTMKLCQNRRDAADKYFCNASMVSSALPVGVAVDILSFSKELKRIKPTALKIDVEGSEYDIILNNPIPASVRWICMEVHKLNAIGAPLFAALVKKLAAQGFGMSPLQPSSRPAPGVLKTFWGFQQVDFSRDYTTTQADARWIDSMIKAAKTKRKTTRVVSLQVLYDREFGYGQ